MNKIKAWFKNRLPSKRRLIQIYAMLLFNANLKGFKTGKIYTGSLKNMCTPGLNCYSCPGASGACPLGALQNSLASSGKTAPYFVFGIIMLYGLLFGRWICGFLCPFGLIQELLHKIPTPKLKKGRITRVLSYFKYVIFVFFVVILPIAYAFRNFPLPGFCKYICPAGTLEGAMGLLSNSVNEGYLAMLGPLFTWKFLLMVSFLVACVFVYRLFCRFICPLGAIYGFFNKISFVGVKVDEKSCTDCGICVNKCKMDIAHVGDHECIFCGECIDVCPTKAISWKGSKFVMSTGLDELDDKDSEKNKALMKERNARIKKRNGIIKTVTAIIMVAVLATALIYYNFIDGKDQTPPIITEESESETQGESTPDKPQKPAVGTSVGNLFPDTDVEIFGRDEKLPIDSLRGKTVVLNFWFTTCGPCIEELPHFYDVAAEYSDDVTVIAVHIEQRNVNVTKWIAESDHPEWSDGTMLIGWDSGEEYKKLFSLQVFPTTIIIDRNGVITDKFFKPLKKDQLVDAIEKAMANGYEEEIETEE